MNEKTSLDLKHPRIGVITFFVSAGVSFFNADGLYSYAKHHLLYGVENWLIILAVKMGLFYSYFIPLIIAAFLMKSKFSVLQDIGLMFGGFGLGILLKIALLFIGAIHPY